MINEELTINNVPIMVSENPETRSEVEYQKQNQCPLPIKTLQMDFLVWISKDLLSSQEEEQRQILYPGELLKKVHIKANEGNIWCFFYERGNFLAFRWQRLFCKILFL